MADASDTTNLSRRLFVGSAAALGAMVGSAAAVGKALSNDQFEAFKRLHAECLAAAAEVDAAKERFGQLLPPGYRFGFVSGGYVIERVNGKDYLFCDPSPTNVASLKAEIAKGEMMMQSIVPLDVVCGRGAVNTAKSTLERLEAYLAMKTKREEETGLRAAVERYEELSDRKYDLACDIIDLEPTNFHDLAIHAAVTRTQFGDDADFGDIINTLIKIAGVQDVIVA